MGKLKKLAGQTAVYGLPSILGRFLNYLLFPLYTDVFLPSEYGIVNEIYALVAFVAVILPWGMETAYFRFVNKAEYSPQAVFSTSLFFVAFSSLVFLGGVIFFNAPLADAISYSQHPEYVLWMGVTLAFDALSVIPLAQLRQQERATRFALVNFVSIGTNIGLNLFFVWYCMVVYRNGGNAITQAVFNPAIGVGYVFIANMCQAIMKFLWVSGAYRQFTFRISGGLLRELISYSSPLVLAGFAGIINETLDRRLIRVILEPQMGEELALAQVGIYGAVYKLSILITLFTQAFRYAAEPFFFAQYKNQDSRVVYATVMKWYTIVVATLFLVVMLYLDVFKLLIRNAAYWEGLVIVPILLVANIFLGWIYNFSVWYKLTNQTQYGAIIAVFGAVITIGVNVWLIPILGYTGAAIATISSYGSMAFLSYALGQRYFKIPYQMGRLLGYLLGAVGVWALSTAIPASGWAHYGVNAFLLVMYLVTVVFMERKSILQLLGR